MPARANVVIFARAPRLGAVKRRLAADIGPVAALRFYRQSLEQTVRGLGRDRRWQAWLAVTPDGTADRGRLWPDGTPRLPQGPGDLGRRMERALRRFAGAPTVIVGSDIPSLGPRHVARALNALGDHDAVFGPCGDGGYWLVGARDIRALGDIFAGVRWSSPHALADTLKNLAGKRVALADRLDDVDDGASLARWRAADGRPPGRG